MGAFTAAAPKSLAAPAAAQNPVSRPEIRVPRITEAEAPKIDGDFSDPTWAKAAVIDHFVQREPDNDALASERTVLRVMYDNENLYFAIYAYDSDPDKLVANAKDRAAHADSVRQHHKAARFPFAVPLILNPFDGTIRRAPRNRPSRRAGLIARLSLQRHASDHPSRAYVPILRD